MNHLTAILAAGILAMSNLSPAAEPVPVTDLHTDILLRIIDHGIDIGEPPEWPSVTIPTMTAGNVKNQVFAVWVNSYGLQGLDATRRALQMMDIYEQQREKYSDKIATAHTVAEAEEIAASGRIAVWLWLEGGAPIADDLAILRTFHRMGVRGMTLTWSNNLLWAGSSTDKDNNQMGLTDFGREVVQEMNRIGMVIDVSHVSEATFFEALELSTDPAIASHSGCRALADHPRNLTDDQLRALAKNGGVVGIPALPDFLSIEWGKAWEETEARLADEVEALKTKYEGNTRAPGYREERRVLLQSNLPEEAKVTVETFVDHIMHAVEIMGVEHVALGSDFDGIWAFPEGLEKASDWPAVADALRARGLDEKSVRAIMHDNALRVFRQVIDE